MIALKYQSLCYILDKGVKIRSCYCLTFYEHPVVHIVIQRFQQCPQVVVITSQADAVSDRKDI